MAGCHIAQLPNRPHRSGARYAARKRFDDLLHIQRGGIKPSEEIDNSNSQEKDGERGARNTPAGASLDNIHDVNQQFIARVPHPS